MRNRSPSRSLVILALAVAACDDRLLSVGLTINGNPVPSGAGAGGATTMPSGSGGQGGAPPAPPPMPSLACPSPKPMPSRMVALTPLALAQRLARLIWRAEPDGPIVMAAAAAQTSADVAALAASMLKGPRAEAGLRALGRGVFDYAKSPKDGVPPELWTSMLKETDLFFASVAGKPGGTLEKLFTANTSFVDASLAAIYEVPAPPSPFAEVPLDGMRRSGILTHASLLASHPRAPQRGTWMNAALICRPLPVAPPPSPEMAAPRPRPGQSFREALTAQTNTPPCSACHTIMDPQGFLLEHFDALGRYRTTDNGAPIDASGLVPSVREPRANANGAVPVALGRQLADSCEVKQCIARHFLSHAVGHDLNDFGSDQVAVDELNAAFVRSGFELHALLLAVVESPLFLAP